MLYLQMRGIGEARSGAWLVHSHYSSTFCHWTKWVAKWNPIINTRPSWSAGQTGHEYYRGQDYSQLFPFDFHSYKFHVSSNLKWNYLYKISCLYSRSYHPALPFTNDGSAGLTLALALSFCFSVNLWAIIYTAILIQQMLRIVLFIFTKGQHSACRRVGAMNMSPFFSTGQNRSQILYLSLGYNPLKSCIKIFSLLSFKGRWEKKAEANTALWRSYSS